MSAIQEYLASEKYEPELYDDYGWKLLDQARAELAQLRTDLQAAHEHIAELEAVINEAHVQMIESKGFCGCIDESCNSCDSLNVWLAAHPETSTRAGA